MFSLGIAGFGIYLFHRQTGRGLPLQANEK